MTGKSLFLCKTHRKSLGSININELIHENSMEFHAGGTLILNPWQNDLDSRPNEGINQQELNIQQGLYEQESNPKSMARFISVTMLKVQLHSRTISSTKGSSRSMLALNPHVYDLKGYFMVRQRQQH